MKFVGSSPKKLLDKLKSKNMQNIVMQTSAWLFRMIITMY